MKSYIRKEKKLWHETIKEFGNYQIIEDVTLLRGIDSDRIWTHYSRTDQFICNTFSQSEIGDAEVINYFVFERPYNNEKEPIYLVTTFWEDCECEGEEEDCEKCEGAGTIATDVI
jgi:hypothetical protein